MRIAVNARLVLPGRMDGIGWFSYETIRRMAQAHPEHEFILFYDRRSATQSIVLPNVRPVVLPPPARHPVLWWCFFEVSVTLALRFYHADVFLSPDGWMPLHTRVPILSVLHDLNFEHADDNLRRSHQRYMKRFFPRFAARATRLATVSEYSKEDIVHTYNIGREKIDVVYDGAHTAYQPLSATRQQEVRDQYTEGAPYFIFIGTILKRKNLTNLLRAFDRFKLQTGAPHKLMVVGARYWWGSELQEVTEHLQFAHDVIFFGRADADTLALLLSSATGLAYVSLFEGFGIPILEAFYAETPVVTSNCTSMPEVAGEAALQVDPNDVEQIATALVDLAFQPQLRQSLIERGREQRRKFSWDRTSELLWNSLMKTLSAT